jgi:hypothetical protein
MLKNRKLKKSKVKSVLQKKVQVVTRKLNLSKIDLFGFDFFDLPNVPKEGSITFVFGEDGKAVDRGC